ncbi:hypothetical protein ES708_10200 [subsurface metagenome]
MIVRQYIKEVYRHTNGELPDIKVLSRKQWAEKFPGMAGISPAFYHIRENIVYFVEVPPDPYDIAHEVHHWYQAQELGVEPYILAIENPETRKEYEKAADDIAGTFGYWIGAEMRKRGLVGEEINNEEETSGKETTTISARAREEGTALSAYVF